MPLLNIKCPLLTSVRRVSWWQIPSFFLCAPAALCKTSRFRKEKHFTINAETFLVAYGVWFICQTSKDAWEFLANIILTAHNLKYQARSGPGGGVLPYMGHIGMCRCEGYGFQAVYSSIGYINQGVWV